MGESREEETAERKETGLGHFGKLRITWWESGSRGAGKTGSVAKPW